MGSESTAYGIAAIMAGIACLWLFWNSAFTNLDWMWLNGGTLVIAAGFFTMGGFLTGTGTAVSDASSREAEWEAWSAEAQEREAALRRRCIMLEEAISTGVLQHPGA